MTKIEFLFKLDEKLSGLSDSDRQKTLDYYNEMIEDRVEDGMAEADAVAEMGDASEIASAIFMETPIIRLVKERVKPKRKLTGAEIALICIASPVWFPVLISLAAAAFAIVIALYAVFYSVIIALYSVLGAIALSSVCSVIISFICLFMGKPAFALLLFGYALIAAGLSILMFFGFNAITKWSIGVNKKAVVGTKRLIAGKRQRGEENMKGENENED